MSVQFHQNLETTNRLLNDPATTAMGGYSLGVVSSLAEQEGIVAPDELLEAATGCQTVKTATDLYRTWSSIRKTRREEEASI
jgi:hypothetical protein